MISSNFHLRAQLEQHTQMHTNIYSTTIYTSTLQFGKGKNFYPMLTPNIWAVVYLYLNIWIQIGKK